MCKYRFPNLKFVSFLLFPYVHTGERAKARAKKSLNSNKSLEWATRAVLLFSPFIARK